MNWLKNIRKIFLNESKGMESGFFSVNSNGDVGRIAADMNIGEVYGPIKISEGYLIFKLLAVRQDSVSCKIILSKLKRNLVKN